MVGFHSTNKCHCGNNNNTHPTPSLTFLDAQYSPISRPLPLPLSLRIREDNNLRLTYTPWGYFVLTFWPQNKGNMEIIKLWVVVKRISLQEEEAELVFSSPIRFGKYEKGVMFFTTKDKQFYCMVSLFPLRRRKRLWQCRLHTNEW